MKSSNKFLLTTLLLLSFQITEAQTEIPIKFSALVEQISLPTFKKHGGNLGFGFNIGSEFKYKTKPKIELAQTGEFYFISHKEYGSSFVFATLFDFRYKPNDFYIDFKIGPSYMLFHNYSPVYKEVNGKYEKASNLQSKFAAIASLSISYQIHNFRPFISYDLLFETPFIQSNSNFLPHQLLQVGCYYNLILKKYEK